MLIKFLFFPRAQGDVVKLLFCSNQWLKTKKSSKCWQLRSWHWQTFSYLAWKKIEIIWISVVDYSMPLHWRQGVHLREQPFPTGHYVRASNFYNKLSSFNDPIWESTDFIYFILCYIKIILSDQPQSKYADTVLWSPIKCRVHQLNVYRFRELQLITCRDKRWRWALSHLFIDLNCFLVLLQLRGVRCYFQKALVCWTEKDNRDVSQSTHMDKKI